MESNTEFDIHQGSWDPLADSTDYKPANKNEPVINWDPLADEEGQSSTDTTSIENKATGEGAETEIEGADVEKPDEETDVEHGDTFQKLSEDLLQMGIFSLDEGEEKLDLSNPDKFAERWAAEKQKGAQAVVQEYVGEKGPAYADAWDKIFVKGLDPFEYFTRQSQIESYENLKLEDNEEAQKQVYRDFQKRQGLSDERIEAKLQKLIDLGELEEEAKDAHGILIATEQKEVEAAAARSAAYYQAEEQRQTQYSNAIHETLTAGLKAKDIDGIPISQQLVASTRDFIQTKKYVLPNGQRISEAEKFWYELQRPENAALMVKYALLAQDGFKTDRIQKKAVSNETNKLFTNLTTKNKEKQRQQTTGSQSLFLD